MESECTLRVSASAIRKGADDTDAVSQLGRGESGAFIIHMMSEGSHAKFWLSLLFTIQA